MLVLNASYEPLNVCTVRRALVLLLKEKAEVLEHGDGVLRSETMRLDRPEVIRLVSFVRVPRDIHRRRITRKAVLARDGWTCQYCGSDKPSLTVDHVIPRSRGGESVWENIVASCAPCNRKKGNRLPHEIRMHPKRNPPPPAPRYSSGSPRRELRRSGSRTCWRPERPPFGSKGEARSDYRFFFADSARCFAVAVCFGLILGLAASGFPAAALSLELRLFDAGLEVALPLGLLALACEAAFLAGLAGALLDPEERLGLALDTFASPLPAASAAAASSATLSVVGASSSTVAPDAEAPLPLPFLRLDHKGDGADPVALLQVHQPDALGRPTHPRDPGDRVALHAGL